MTVTIVAEQGSHVLITRNGRFAVVERRENRFYNCHDEGRAGTPAADLSAVTAILDEHDWTDRETATATFEAVVARGAELAQRMY